MKTIKGLGIFTFFITLAGCFSPPEFSNVPSIDSPTALFIRGKDSNAKDTLLLTVNFRDGDGDIGLSDNENAPPYHSTTYFIENNGQIDSLGTSLRYSNVPPVLLVPVGKKGKLMTYRTRSKVVNGQKPYESRLPAYVDPYRCTAYRYDSIFVSAEDTAAVYSPKEHYLGRIMKSRTEPSLYVLKDTFYYKPNPFVYNIDIEFWILQNNNTYQKFELPINFNNCLSYENFFNGRIPYLSETSSPVEGTLKYKMETYGLLPFFGNRTIKLKIKIYDRALHASNVVETTPFMIR